MGPTETLFELKAMFPLINMTGVLLPVVRTLLPPPVVPPPVVPAGSPLVKVPRLFAIPVSSRADPLAPVSNPDPLQHLTTISPFLPVEFRVIVKK